MAYSPIDELLDRIRARQLVLVVGSGISLATTRDPRASWTGLIEDGIEFCCSWADAPADWADRARQALESNDPLAAGQMISTLLSDRGKPRGLLAKWLFTSVGQLRVERFDALSATPQRSSLIDALWRLSCPIITTNYDTLIEDATGAGSVTCKNPQLVQIALEHGEPRLIVHIHGVWGDSKSVVLSHEDYGDLRGQGEVKTALQASAYTSALLFVGCGAGTSDPTFSQLREWLITELRWTLRSHFLLAQNQEVEGLESAMHSDPIKVIGYGDELTDLEPFIRSRLLPAVEGPVLDMARSRQTAGAMVAADLRAAGRVLHLNDAVVLLEAELRRCEQQLGCTSGLLNQIEDRLGPPPGHWRPIDQEERHHFYASATALLASWLAPEIDILRQTAEALRPPVTDYLITARGTVNGASVANPMHSMLQAVRAAAVVARGTGHSVHALLLQRVEESALWNESNARMAPLLDSLEYTLDRLVALLDEASLQPAS